MQTLVCFFEKFRQFSEEDLLENPIRDDLPRGDYAWYGAPQANGFFQFAYEGVGLADKPIRWHGNARVEEVVKTMLHGLARRDAQDNGSITLRAAFVHIAHAPEVLRLIVSDKRWVLHTDAMCCRSLPFAWPALALALRKRAD